MNKKSGDTGFGKARPEKAVLKKGRSGRRLGANGWELCDGMVGGRFSWPP
jgi:hypothetical protein